MICKHCSGSCNKKGKFGNTQKYQCKSCSKYQRERYCYQSYIISDKQIALLTMEGCGIRSISRILDISPTTIIKRILQIASQINRPYPIIKGKSYQVDEMFTFVKHKKNKVCIAYSLEVETGHTIDFVVGRRNKTNLKKVINTLILAEAVEITTDKLNIYKSLIPNEIHNTKFRGINKIERNNLSLRTHLKRLNRRSICFSKSPAMLLAIVKIYFWYIFL